MCVCLFLPLFFLFKGVGIHETKKTIPSVPLLYLSKMFHLGSNFMKRDKSIKEDEQKKTKT